ncbi:MAG: hypothetical protein Q4F28_16020, partial [Eubacteriales bacterium]|nr:hypothetical protein [Eubacteriales bacterium]
GTGDGTAAGSGTGDGTAAGATAGQSDRMVSYQQTYDSQKGLYRITPKQDGSFVLYSNVPNGMITGTAVLLDTAEMGTCRDQMKLLRNGEAYELPEDGILQECGSYTVLIPAGERQLVYGFRILAGACSDLDIYVVPEGCQVTVFTKDGADMPVASETGVGYLNLKEDGVYRLEMTDGVHSYQTEFTVDHEAPVFDVLVEGSGAEISYGSDDIRYVEVTHGGETQTYTSLTMLNGSGTYEIAMYDEAGNCTVKTVEIPYRVNPAGVIAVILTLGLVAAAVIFVRNTKHNMNVK